MVLGHARNQIPRQRGAREAALITGGGFFALCVNVRARAEIDGARIVELIGSRIEHPTIRQLQPVVIGPAKIAFHQLALYAMKVQQAFQRPADSVAHRVAVTVAQQPGAKVGNKLSKFVVRHRSRSICSVAVMAWQAVPSTRPIACFDNRAADRQRMLADCEREARKRPHP